MCISPGEKLVHNRKTGASFSTDKMAGGYATAYKEVLAEHVLDLQKREVPGTEFSTERFVA